MIVLDETTCEGLQLKYKVENISLIPCVCYLPPENSLRRADVNAYYDNLLADVYKYQRLGTMLICSDFISRYGDLEDFMTGVDLIQHCYIVAFKTNFYGET